MTAPRPTAPRAGVLVALLFGVLALAGCAANRVDRTPLPVTDFTRGTDTQRLADIIASADLQLTSGEEYYIGPGDLISVQLVGREDVLVSKEAQPGVDIRVTDSAMLTFPLVGAMRVHGKTALQLQEELKAAYSQFILDPKPVVIIKEFRRNRVSVLGSVVNPGSYPIEFGDTLIDAIFKAGGLSMGGRGGGLAPAPVLKVYREKLSQQERAELSLEELIARVSEDDRVVPREEIVIPIDEFLFNGVLTYNIPLRQNDIVYVPPAGTVMVRGSVFEPGVAFLGPSVMTVTQVITDRGGLEYGADSQIEVVRTLRDGSVVSYFMDVRRMLDRTAPDFAIKDGDQVIVYGHPWREFLSFLGSFFKGSIRAGAQATYNPIG